jgi:DNA processing protein
MNASKMNALHLVALLSAPGIGRRTVQQILKADLAFAPSRPQELRDLLLETKADNPRTRVPTAAEMEKAYTDAERLLENAERLGVRVLSPDSAAFPNPLRNIPDPPVVLYARGNIDCISTESAVAVVGTREPSAFGQVSAQRIAGALAAKGLIVVSGLAIGCDAEAHSGCLQANGQTVAVMAHGLDQIYPAQNRDLAYSILDSGGCLVSEYPPGTKPRSNFFVERDRLQSGLSAAVVIVETDVAGGTMHTARFCLEQRRLLGCLVHPPKFASHPKARGNQKLLAEEGAFPLSSKEAIEEFVGLFYKPDERRDRSEESDAQSEERDHKQMSFFYVWG